MARAEIVKKRIQVVFNILDPDQLSLYKHVKNKPNQSSYMKRLIQRDIDVGFVLTGMGPVTVAAATNEGDFDLGSFIG